jgi:glutathione synthase/RimK-type ligase-like ATP-grasp enzyme
MSARLLILTPAPGDARFGAIVHRWVERLSAALALAGVAAEARPWTEAEDVSGFDGVAPLLAWSYHLDLAGWTRRLDALAAAGARTVNPLASLRWNTHKTYLAELEAAGAPIVPTLFVPALTAAAIAEAHDRFGDQLIAKPQVSAGAFATVRIVAGRPFEGAPTGAAMLQPFLPAVGGEGELSLLYFGGRFSHAIAKVAQAGDFRVQYQYGGVNTPIDPPPEAMAAAEQVLAAAPPLTYARVDLVRDPTGRMRLMELEAIEPDLFLEHAPDAGAAFARAMRAALAQDRALDSRV